MHPLIKVMLVGGKADGLLVSVADTATEVSVTPAQYGAPSGLPLNFLRQHKMLIAIGMEKTARANHTDDIVTGGGAFNER